MSAQIHEILILDGQETTLACCPPIRRDPRIREVGEEEARLDSEGVLFSTACWRGYQGTWEIKEGRLHLLALRGGLRLDEPIFADWVTGELRIPQGDVLKYIHMEFATVYERELHIKVEKGLVSASRTLDNRGKDLDGLGSSFQIMLEGGHSFELDFDHGDGS